MIRIMLFPLLSLLVIVGFQDEAKPVLSSESAYPEHLTGAFTGGFGEETCRSCHFDYDLNPEGGNLKVTGIPERLQKGEILSIEVMVERDDLGRAGFQMTARFEDGTQAGEFVIGDNNHLMFTKGAGADGLQYIQHSATGSEVDNSSSRKWLVRWKAPESIDMPIIFNISANAANGDQSEFGDYIHSREVMRSR